MNHKKKLFDDEAIATKTDNDDLFGDDDLDEIESDGFIVKDDAEEEESDEEKEKEFSLQTPKRKLEKIVNTSPKKTKIKK